MSATLLRGATELATLTGAADAAVVVGRGGDFELIDSAHGTFARRTIAAERCPQLGRGGVVALGSGPWLGMDALAELYLPLYAHVLALPCVAEGFSGALLLRYDRRPVLSPADHVFLASAAADIACEHAEERAALRAAASTPSTARTAPAMRRADQPAPYSGPAAVIVGTAASPPPATDFAEAA